jgi:hypothetical protein
MAIKSFSTTHRATNQRVERTCKTLIRRNGAAFEPRLISGHKLAIALCPALGLRFNIG